MERIRRDELYRSKIISVYTDQVRFPDGQVRERAVVEHPGAVVVVAEEGGELLFVRQFRYAAGETLIELVAGTLEPGEDPLTTAHRELQEEAGFKAGRMTKLGEFYSAPGFCSELLHLYLAQDLTPSRLAMDEDEEIVLERYSTSDALLMVGRGELRDAKTLAGLMLYVQHAG
jgi:ADP-ribose pyrophosphatase